jgi:hypothetical protein
MRLALILVALLVLLPVAAARPSLPSPPVTVGPCIVNWSYLWPGEAVGVRCAAEGETVAASYGTCALGDYVYVQVGSGYVLVPCNLISP